MVLTESTAAIKCLKCVGNLNENMLGQHSIALRFLGKHTAEGARRLAREFAESPGGGVHGAPATRWWEWQ